MRYLTEKEDKAAWAALKASTKKIAGGRMSDSNDLLPCPFCGSKVWMIGWGWISITCHKCDITFEDRNGVPGNKEHERRLSERWNKRCPMTAKLGATKTSPPIVIEND